MTGLAAVPQITIDRETVPDSGAPVTAEDVEQSAHQLQAESEGVKLVDHITFMGREFKIRPAVSLMALMKFAHAANSGLDTEKQQMRAMAAMFSMIKSCIDPEEWPDFEEFAEESTAVDTDYMDVINQTMELLSARPTRQPGGSSAEPSAGTPRSTDGPSQRASALGLTPVSQVLAG
jgi:hypothetical protein